jgi:hypothetical protein
MFDIGGIAMNKETMIKNYRRFSAADSYVLGFIYKHEVYIIEVKEIMPRFMRVEHESSKKGWKCKTPAQVDK